MDCQKKHRIKKLLFGIFGIVIIPVYGYLFALNGPDGNLIIVTFSQIGSRYGAVESLILWGILSTVYYFSLLDYLLFLTGYKNILLHINLGLSCLSMVVTVFLPFAPTMFPLVSRTHNFLARVSAFSFLATTLIFISYYLKKDKVVFFKALMSFLFVLAANIYVIINYGISSLFQIVLSATFCPFLFINLLFLEKSPLFDIYSVLAEAETKNKENSDIF